MIKCTKCKKEKIDSDFNFKIKNKGLRQRQCKECTRLLIKNHYKNNRQYYLNKANNRNNQKRTEVISYLREYLLKNPCVDCSEADITVLEFDHKGKIQKFKAVSSLIRNRYSLEIVKNEVSKCEVRCANCHRRKTARDFNWAKSKTHSW